MIELAGNILIRDGEILLLYREEEGYWESQRSQGESCSTSNPEGYWDVPGGKVKKGESPTETAVREAREEIGAEVELEKPFYSGEFQREDEIFLWHGYIASTDEEPEIQEDRFEKMIWADPVDLDDMSLASNLEMVLPALRRIR